MRLRKVQFGEAIPKNGCSFQDVVPYREWVGVKNPKHLVNTYFYVYISFLDIPSNLAFREKCQIFSKFNFWTKFYGFPLKFG